MAVSPNFSNSLYIEANFDLYIRQVTSQQRLRIENLRRIINTHFNGNDDEDITTFFLLENYHKECDKQISNIRTVLNSKERRVLGVLYNLKKFVKRKTDIRRQYKKYPENIRQYHEQFEDVNIKIEMIKYIYRLLSNQFEELARYSVQAIDVLQEHKTFARNYYNGLLLNRSNRIFRSLNRTEGDKDDVHELFSLRKEQKMFESLYRAEDEDDINRTDDELDETDDEDDDEEEGDNSEWEDTDGEETD
jgi:hypothetical protein